MPPGTYPDSGDGYWQSRDDHHGNYRERPRPGEGYRPRPRNAYPERGYDGYPSHRDDGYPPRRDEGFAGNRGAYRAPGPRPEYPPMPDGRFAPHPAAPHAYYDGNRDRVAGDRGVAYDRPADGRPADGRPADGRPAYGRPADGRPAYGRPRYERPASGPAANDRAAQSFQRPGTNALPSPESWPERPVAASKPSAESAADLVPSRNEIAIRAEHPPAQREDDILTSPLPVILPGATSVPRPAAVETPRGPFEPAQPVQAPVRPASVTGSVELPPAAYQRPVPPPPRDLPPAATAKLDQIKDLYLTAEAIGPDALDKHFDQVSQRQRDLIKEFFHRSEPGDTGADRP